MEIIYLYKEINFCGNTIEFLLRKYRDAAAVKVGFFQKTFIKNKAKNSDR
ncbi:hypothetical protein OCHUTO_0353 [Orientia chuto str. Dubai]|uniref:DDE domain-containing protein n=1 Tax=Orientia chuto str. Dubai TaxID=1359168 RepID=A0A0F3MM01_9RICK|nr:hypothetical protein OCHUTO_0353 [Orientia chuto str. Dubai]